MKLYFKLIYFLYHSNKVVFISRFISLAHHNEVVLYVGLFLINRFICGYSGFEVKALALHVKIISLSPPWTIDFFSIDLDHWFFLSRPAPIPKFMNLELSSHVWRISTNKYSLIIISLNIPLKLYYIWVDLFTPFWRSLFISEFYLLDLFHCCIINGLLIWPVSLKLCYKSGFVSPTSVKCYKWIYLTYFS